MQQYPALFDRQSRKGLTGGGRILGAFGVFLRLTLRRERGRRRALVEDMFRGIAQPGRAPALGAGSPVFESPCPDHGFKGLDGFFEINMTGFTVRCQRRKFPNAKG